MRYNINNINTSHGFLFFWGHQPSKDGSIIKSCLSQWWLSSFIVNSIEYKTAEHWMMAQKASLFNDETIFQEIISTENPAVVKKLGRKVSNFDTSIWEKNCYEIVKNGNLYKFSQNQSLMDFLLSTEDKIIVEASPVDFIWGIGLEEKNPDTLNPQKWKGENLLGFALMEVRDELKHLTNRK